MQTAKIKSITYLGKEDVYNMEVEGHHNFSVNGGLIVHNCYDSVGYGIISHHAKFSKNPEPPIPPQARKIHEHIKKMTKKNKTAKRYKAV